MDNIAIFDQNMIFLVLLKLNILEIVCSVYIMVVWDGNMLNDLQQLELWDAQDCNAPIFYKFHLGSF